MMKFSLGRRQRLALLGAVCAAIGMSSGSASATLQLDTATDTRLAIDGDTHDWQGGINPTTHGAYQYVAYWDAVDTGTREVYLKLTRRTLANDRLEDIRFDQPADAWSVLIHPDDGHNYVTIGLSPSDERIHVSFSNHVPHPGDKSHHYGYSSAGCLSEARFSDCTWTWTSGGYQADRDAESRFTYPRYFNDQSGNLYLAYRHGIAHDGDEYMNAYNNDGTWSFVGRILWGRDGSSWDPDGAGRTYSAARTRGPYLGGLEFDKNDRLHMMWTWREGVPENVNSSHDYYYAYSDDYGATWHDDAGTTIARAGTRSSRDGISLRETTTLAVSVGHGGYPGMHSRAMVLDSDNQPHFIVPTATVPNYEDWGMVVACQHHFWRTENSAGTVAWYSQQVEAPGDCDRRPRGGDTIMLDRADNAYFIDARVNFGWYPFNVDTGYQDELPYANVTWQGGEYMDIQLYSATTDIGTDEYIGVPISTRGNNQVRINMRNDTAATGLTIYWITDTDTTWDNNKRQVFTRALTARDRRYSPYTFTISDPEWDGTIKAMEIYLDGMVSTGSQSYDYIRITNAAGTIAKGWEFREGQRIVAAEASANGNWGTWRIEDLLPGFADTLGDSGFTIDRQRYADSKVVNFMTTEQGGALNERLAMHQFDIRDDDVLKDWHFSVNDQFWAPVLHITGARWASDGGLGTLTGTITGNDSSLNSTSNLAIDIGTARTVEVTMKVSDARNAMVCWVVNGRLNWNLNRCSRFAVRADGRYNPYSISTSGWRDWSGQELYAFKLEPSDDVSVTRGTFNIDRIRILE